MASVSWSRACVRAQEPTSSLFRLRRARPAPKQSLGLRSRFRDTTGTLFGPNEDPCAFGFEGPTTAATILAQSLPNICGPAGLQFEPRERDPRRAGVSTRPLPSFAKRPTSTLEISGPLQPLRFREQGGECYGRRRGLGHLGLDLDDRRNLTIERSPRSVARTLGPTTT